MHITDLVEGKEYDLINSHNGNTFKGIYAYDPDLKKKVLSGVDQDGVKCHLNLIRLNQWNEVPDESWKNGL